MNIFTYEGGYNHDKFNKIKEDIVIVHYISLDRDSDTSAVRTSIWMKVDCDWKMYFHQGTPTDINILL